MVDVILANRNPSKIEQIRPFFTGLPIRLLTLEEAGIVGEAVEDTATLEQNALKKAQFAASQREEWIVAEDSGIFIDALDGRPGAYSARWAGKYASAEETIKFTLKQMREVLPERRTATFKTVAVVLSSYRSPYVLVGEARGVVLPAPRVPCKPKMPYGGLFVPDGQTKTLAEMSVEEENAVSHRGKAFRLVRALFEEILK